MDNLNPARKHVPSLDGLRALAILGVVVVHCYYRGPSSGLSGLAAQCVILGWTGLDLSFVLSGFLVTMALLETKGSGGYFRNFYVKKIGRVFPLYYAILIGFLVVNLVHIPKVTAMLGNYIGHWWVYFIFISNLDGMLGWNLNNPLGPAWPMALAAQYYLVWPALVLLLNRPTLKILLPTLLIGLAILRFVLTRHYQPIAIYHFTLTRADAIITGSAVAVYWDEIVKRVKYFYFTLPVISVILVVIFLTSGSTHYENTEVKRYGLIFIAAFYGNILIISIFNPVVSRALSAKPLRVIGKYSYCIYLIHWPMLLVASQLPLPDGPLPWLAFVVVFIALTTGLAAISWVVLEKPMAAWIRRLGLAHQEV